MKHAIGWDLHGIQRTILSRKYLFLKNQIVKSIGAPLIAVVANLGLAVDLCTNAKTISELDALDPNDGTALLNYLQTKLDYLATSRPTAVNLFHALAEIKDILQQQVDVTSSTVTTLRQRMVQAVKEYAEFALKRDVDDCKAIGKHGADELLTHVVTDRDRPLRLMTICNTGSLAAAGYGTALGVVRAVHERHRLQQIVALETRPYNQGSRLTAFEMVEDHLPGATLICDSMAAAFFSKHRTDAVIVGADRVCANGDTANKIGTYNLSLVAAAHQVPVYVAAPFTTLDLSLASGKDIVIEERPPSELLETSRAPKVEAERLGVWNPAFDVTPHKYLSGIITEKGVIRPEPDGTMNVKAFVEAHTQSTEGTDSTKVTPVYNRQYSRKLSAPIEYTEQSVTTLPSYLVRKAPDACNVLGTNEADDLECVEVGDGNLNLVFIVTNKKDRSKQVIVKQALPYVRCVGESWPLTLERSFFEYKALTAQKSACPEFVPSIYYFSKSHGLLVMEYLAPPNIILRKGLIQGIQYPTMASDMGIFCAKTLFKTSGFRLTPEQLRKQLEFWSRNAEMCSLTEQVVFTEPYMTAPNNRWTSPQLDEDKKAIENDVELKTAAAHLKHKFVTETQALIHADLHSGSVMCSPEPGQTFVIDPEFAFYGPMAFDLGAFVANLFLAYCAQPGQANGEDYGDWILQQIQIFWSTFVEQFTKLWNDPMEHTGYLYGRQTLESPESIESSQQQFMTYLLKETLGFAGMKMLRRIVGIAHVEDLECIQDVEVKAKCERHGLEIAKELIKTYSERGDSIENAILMARSKKQA